MGSLDCKDENGRKWERKEGRSIKKKGIEVTEKIKCLIILDRKIETGGEGKRRKEKEGTNERGRRGNECQTSLILK